MASPSSADSGLAIVPFVGNPEQKNDDDPPQRKEWPAVDISLKKITSSKLESKEMSSEDKRAPAAGLFFKLPNDSLKDVFVTSMQLPAEEQNRFSKKRLARNVQLSRLINFVLPDDTFETVKKMNEKAQDRSVKQFSLRERLEGWEVEKREREINGRVDKYYFHKKSGQRFRSFLEVESFIVHENIPQKRFLGSISRGQKRGLEGSSSSHDNPGARVKKFLQESYDNLANLEKKVHLGPPTRTDEVKVKKFLKQAHRNLLNVFGAQKDQYSSDDKTESGGKRETNQLKVKEDYSQGLTMELTAVPAQGKKEGQGEPAGGEDSTTEPFDENAAMVNELMTDEPLIINELPKVHGEPSDSDVAALKESDKNENK